jgi:glucosamine--fructose-6-phosphate aminotransferase (isomerizing)
MLQGARSMLVLGRGLTLPVAGEAALKLKETSNLHAEAFSIAEVAHGPMTLVGADDPVFVFGPLDVAREGLRARIEDFVQRGAQVIATGAADDVATATRVLPSPFEPATHPALAAVAQMQSFYGLANALALARGRDPDSPPHLAKVTSTL